MAFKLSFRKTITGTLDCTYSNECNFSMTLLGFKKKYDNQNLKLINLISEIKLLQYSMSRKNCT